MKEDANELLKKAVGQARPTEVELAGKDDTDAKAQRVSLTNPQAQTVADQTRLDFHLVRRMFPAPGAVKAAAEKAEAEKAAAADKAATSKSAKAAA